MCSYAYHQRLVKVFLITSAVVVVAACTEQEPARVSEVNPIERGNYLVTMGGCGDCHTPKLFTADGPQPDGSRLLSGHPANAKLPPVPSGVVGPDGWGAIANNDLTAWVGPWGISFSANLTPDATGLGSWSPETFINAMRNGKHAGVGRDILPPMPWMAYAKMTDDDLRAMFAYLKSLPPISNAVPEPVPPAAGSAPKK